LRTLVSKIIRVFKKQEQPPMEKQRTALDAYRDFGEAFDKLVAELVELDVTPTAINLDLARLANVPHVLAAPLIRIVVGRRANRAAVKPRIPTFESPNPFARASGPESDPVAPSGPSGLAVPTCETQASSEPTEGVPIDMEELRRRVAAANEGL
jgi:hypothetical protein